MTPEMMATLTGQVAELVQTYSDNSSEQLTMKLKFELIL